MGITVGKGDEEEQSRDLIQGGSSTEPERPMEVPTGDVMPKEESTEAPLSPYFFFKNSGSYGKTFFKSSHTGQIS